MNWFTFKKVKISPYIESISLNSIKIRGNDDGLFGIPGVVPLVKLLIVICILASCYVFVVFNDSLRVKEKKNQRGGVSHPDLVAS